MAARWAQKTLSQGVRPNHRPSAANVLPRIARKLRAVRQDNCGQTVRGASGGCHSRLALVMNTLGYSLRLSKNSHRGKPSRCQAHGSQLRAPKGSQCIRRRSICLIQEDGNPLV
eukprot:scaffold279393_cov35-Tisochrysis_lutea.AAC.1